MEFQPENLFSRGAVKIPDVQGPIRKAAEEKSKNLKLGKCWLSEIPLEVFSLEHLETLDLSNNNIATIPPQISQLKNLKTLILQKNQIRSLPREIGELINLNRLILGYNNLNKLPEIFGLEHLQTLDLSNNNIVPIPPQIAQLKNLKTLVLRNNQITTIPKEIGELSNLSRLLLGGNVLKDLPESIAYLKKIKELHLTSNYFTEILDPIFSLRELKVLWLSFNKINAISDKISQLTNLKTLYIKGNKLQEVPESLVKLAQLEAVFLEGNPMYLTPLYDWSGNRLPQLRTYFSSLQDGAEKSYTAKLIFIGKGSEGKTTLREILINRNISIKELQEITLTEGVEIKKLNNIHAEDDKYYDISMWDFGGQEILRNIHHLFLTDSALYLLLWSSRSAENKYAYFKEWLSIVNAENPDSKVKVILIQNKAIEEGAIKDLVDQEKLKKLFPKLVDFINISALKGTGVDELRKMIRGHLKDLPTVKIVSGRWMAVKSNIEKFKANKKIKYEDFTTLCYKYQVSDRKEVDQFLEWLHHIGAVLWYKSIPALRGTIYLDPEWVSKEVSRILIGKSESIRKNNGKFFIQDIIDENNSTPENIDKVIQLMEEFNLCFELDKKDRSYIIPLLLPEDIPISVTIHDWAEDTLDFQYQYSLIPRGILSQFIAWAYKEGYLEDGNYWLNGALLIYGDDTSALVTYEFLEKDSSVEAIRIQVKGIEKEEFLKIIWRKFDTYLNIRAKLQSSLLSCRGLGCTNPENNYFDMEVIETMRKRKVKTAQCQKCFRDMPVEKFIRPILPKGNDDKSLPEVNTNQGINVFISYAHKDKEYFKVFKESFESTVKLSGMKSVTDEVIPVGSKWDEFLKDYVTKCDIMILCVSHDFMNSTYIREDEFGAALKRLQKGHRLLIVPVYFMTCEIGQDTNLSALQFFKPEGTNFGARDDNDFSFSTLVTFTNENTVRVNKNNWHRYMVELKKKIEHAWEELNKENKRAN